MSDLAYKLGKIEERLERAPSLSQQVWTSIGGTAAVVAIALGVMAIFLPREFDRLAEGTAALEARSTEDFAAMQDAFSIRMTTQDTLLGSLREDTQAIRNAVNPRLIEMDARIDEVFALRGVVMNQHALLERVRNGVAVLRNSNEFKPFAGVSDRDAMLVVVRGMSEADRDELLSSLMISVEDAHEVLADYNTTGMIPASGLAGRIPQP